MDILVCLIAEQQIGLELDRIHSVVLAVETTPLPNAPDYFVGAINVHGQITLVIDMHKLLGGAKRELKLEDQFILCDIHQKQVALWVDSVKSIKHFKKEELIPADQVLPDLLGLQYVFKEDGQIILIYDLEKLLPLHAISFYGEKIQNINN